MSRRILAAILFVSAPSVALGAEQIVVPEVSTTGVQQDVAALVTELILEALLNRHGIKALGPSDVKDMLNVEQQKMLMGCDQNSCMAELAGAMGAGRVIAGMVGRLGSLYVVTLKLVDTNSARVVARASRRFKQLEQVPEAVGPLVDDLLSAKPKRATSMAPIFEAAKEPKKKPKAMSVRALCKVSKSYASKLVKGPWSETHVVDRRRILEDTLYTPFLKQFDEKIACIKAGGGGVVRDVNKQLFAAATKALADDALQRKLEWLEMVRLLDLLVEAYHVGFEKEKNGAGRRPSDLPFAVEARQIEPPEDTEAVRRFLDDYESAQKTVAAATAAAKAKKERTFRKLWTKDPKRSGNAIDYSYKRVSGYAADGWQIEPCPIFVLSALEIERSARRYARDQVLEGCYRRKRAEYVTKDRVKLKNVSGSKWQVDRW